MSCKRLSSWYNSKLRQHRRRNGAVDGRWSSWGHHVETGKPFAKKETFISRFVLLSNGHSPFGCSPWPIPDFRFVEESVTVNRRFPWSAGQRIGIPESWTGNHASTSSLHPLGRCSIRARADVPRSNHLARFAMAWYTPDIAPEISSENRRAPELDCLCLPLPCGRTTPNRSAPSLPPLIATTTKPSRPT